MNSESKNVVMAIGAHIIDAELTSGMLLAKHAMAGDKIVTVALTAGERLNHPGMSNEEFREVNVASAATFAKALGGESFVFDVPDGELFAGKEIELKLAKLMREQKVTHVLYHWRNSRHKDHEQASIISRYATYYAALKTMDIDGLQPATIKRKLYAENFEDAIGFVPFYFFDVTKAFPLWKEAIMNFYGARNSPARYVRYYEALAMERGNLIGTDYAVTFGVDECFRWVVQEYL